MPTYLVHRTSEPEAARLIDAPNKASAIRHFAQSTIIAEVATLADAHRLAKAGVEIEAVGSEAGD